MTDLEICILNCDGYTTTHCECGLKFCAIDSYNTYVQDIRYMILSAMIGSFIYLLFYISFTITIIHNNKYEKTITALCKPVGNGILLPCFGNIIQFFEVTHQRNNIHVEATNFVDECMNTWTTLFGAHFVQQTKHTVMLYEYQWGKYYTRSRLQIIVITIFYIIAFGLSIDRFFVWWFLYDTY